MGRNTTKTNLYPNTNSPEWKDISKRILEQEDQFKKLMTDIRKVYKKLNFSRFNQLGGDQAEYVQKIFNDPHHVSPSDLGNLWAEVTMYGE